MKQFIYICAWVFILSCHGIMLTFAGDAEMGSALLLSQKGIQSQSAASGEVSAKFQNIEGTLKEIQGNVYLVEAEGTNESIRVEIGRDTAFPNGQKEPGQLLQALISTSNGHALIVR